MKNLFDSKRNFYYFVTTLFILNLIMVSLTVIFITNMTSNSQVSTLNQGIKSKLEEELSSLISKYEKISKRNNVKILRYRFNPNIQVADIIENVEKSTFTSGIKIVNTEVISSTDTEIVISISTQGSLGEIKDFIAELERKYLVNISELNLYMSNQDYVLSSKYTFYKERSN